MANKQDFFISHASSDKAEYVEPLAQALKDRNVTYWLDNSAMAWGDRLATKINEGLRITRHVLVCLSRTFLERPWPEAEMSAAFSAAKGKKILPLILNDKERVLQHYPLIRGMVYREFSAGVDKIADELRSLSTTSSKEAQDLDFFQISIESVHEGKVSFLHAQRRKHTVAE